MGRETGLGVDIAVGRAESCCFLDFFRADSVPLTSDKFGDPGRFKVERAFFRGSECLFLPEGVLVPLVDSPDGSRLPSASLPLGFSFVSADLAWSSSFPASSESSEDVYLTSLAHPIGTDHNVRSLAYSETYPV